MSHPNPHHDPDNVYPDDNYKPVSKETRKAKIDSDHDKVTKSLGLGGAFGMGALHGRRERHNEAKRKAMAKKMGDRVSEMTRHNSSRHRLSNSSHHADLPPGHNDRDNE